MARDTKWFDNIFLMSFEDKMNNPKYPNQCILSDGQVRVCERYMESHSGSTMSYHKPFLYYTYKVGCREYRLEFRGRYAFLHRCRVAYKMEDRQRIHFRRLDRKEDRIYFERLKAKEV